jgi:very-short-patch-repair endonuclease
MCGDDFATRELCAGIVLSTRELCAGIVSPRENCVPRMMTRTTPGDALRSRGDVLRSQPKLATFDQGGMREYSRGLTRSKQIDHRLVGAARRMRRNPTPSEAAAWSVLRRDGLFGLHFRRQQVIDRFVVDFYCHALRLCLEIDGDVHHAPEQREADDVRQARLESLGFEVVRVSADEVSRETLERAVRPYFDRRQRLPGP